MGCFPSDLWLHGGGRRGLVGIFRPERLGALFALLGWLTTHFDVAFDEQKEGHESVKNQRILTVVIRPGRANRRKL